MPLVQTIPSLKISVNPEKLTNDSFYHVIFFSEPKIELSRLPLPYLINGEEFFLTDLAKYPLFDLPSQLIKESHGMSLSAYMFRMIEKFPKRFKSETEMLVCKFSKQPNI